MRLAIRVVPNASRDEVAGWMGEELKVRVQAPPEGGRANKAVVKLLAQVTGLPKKQIAIVTGETSRNKKVEISGLTQSEFNEKIEQL